MVMTKPMSPDLPTCMRCGRSDPEAVTSPSIPQNEMWFRCLYCHRVFCVRFTADTTTSDEPK